jgi:hypothetical protein
MVYGPNARRLASDSSSASMNASMNRRGYPASRPPSQPVGGRAQDSLKVTRGSLGALAHGWLRLLSPGVWAPVNESPHPLVVRAVRWAPIIAPAVIDGALLLCTLGLVAHVGRPAFALLPQSLIVPAVLGAYLVCSALLGVALYFAPNGVVWSLALVGIPPTLLTIMLGLAFGLPGALLALAAFAALLLLYSAARHALTRPGVVDVTLLMGEWYRTLPPGYNILLPGERVIVALRTSPRTYTTPLQRIALGSGRIAQARATVSYVVNAREAWRTASVRATWEDELHQRVSASVRESLGEWRYTPDGDLAAHGSIAQRALDDTRDWARSIGIRILSIRAHDIVVGAPAELQPRAPQAESLRARATPRVAPTYPPYQSYSAHPAHPVDAVDAMDRELDHDDGGLSDEPAPVSAPLATPSAPPIAHIPAMGTPSARAPLERPSPEALEDLYEAVRNRQITDTQVIREIASHFAALAREPAASAALPFDPIAAASLLDEYAEALDTARPVRPAQRARRR